MLSRLRIGNFRAFKPLNIEKLGKINLFSGRNNSGKTSLLEAIFLLSAAPKPAFLLNANVIRGVKVLSGSEHVVQNALWKPIFHDLDMSDTIEITGHHFSSGELTVRLTVERPNLFELPLDTENLMLGENLQNKEILSLNYILNGTSKAKFNISLAGNSMHVEPNQPDVEIPFPSTILSTRNRNSEEDAQRLGQLRQQKKGELVVEALRVIDPNLQSIEENTATGVPMIWGDVGLNELVPLPVMGDGMTQLARIVLAISSTPGGIILIDEIENGLHHSVLSQIWRVVQKASDQFNAQIIATTHSYECIEAAEKVFQNSNDNDFLFHRLDTDETGTRCVTYNKETITAAMQHHMEVR